MSGWMFSCLRRCDKQMTEFYLRRFCAFNDFLWSVVLKHDDYEFIRWYAKLELVPRLRLRQLDIVSDIIMPAKLELLTELCRDIGLSEDLQYVLRQNDVES